MTKEELWAALDAAEIQYDKRWGVDRLQAALQVKTDDPPVIVPEPAPQAERTWPFRVLRDFWTADGERVRKGRIVDVTAEEGFAALTDQSMEWRRDP